MSLVEVQCLSFAVCSLLGATQQHHWAMCCPPTADVYSTKWSHSMHLTSLSVGKSGQTAELTWSKDSKPHTNTLKTHNLTATTPAPCGEHSVSGKGVIFTAVSSVQSQPTWQSVSLLIGLMLGSLLQNFIVRIIIDVIEVAFHCAISHSKAICVLHVAMLIMLSECKYQWQSLETVSETTLTTLKQPTWIIEANDSSHNLTGIIGFIQKPLNSRK